MCRHLFRCLVTFENVRESGDFKAGFIRQLNQHQNF